VAEVTPDLDISAVARPYRQVGAGTGTRPPRRARSRALTAAER
jgi:hypothetical protein